MRELKELQVGVYLFSFINTVKRNFYVDDCLESLPSNAIQHVDSFRVLLSRGGFKITKWISNSRNVLETVLKLAQSKDIKNFDPRKDE